MPLADTYTAEIRTNLRRFATWEPGAPMKLGDYGELRGSMFVRLGNVADSSLGVEFSTRSDATRSHVSYSSAGAVSVDFSTDVELEAPPIAVGRLGLRIAFGRENAVFFNAADVRYDSIADQTDLERQLLQLLAERKWRGEHAIVTEVTGAGSTTVIVSSGRSSEIVLEADGNVPRIDFADASLRLGVKSEKGIAYKAITDTGITPMLSLSRIRPRGAFWSRRNELVRELGFSAEGRGAAIRTDALITMLEDDLGFDIILDQVHAAGEAAHDAFRLQEVRA